MEVRTYPHARTWNTAKVYFPLVLFPCLYVQSMIPIQMDLSCSQTKLIFYTQKMTFMQLVSLSCDKGFYKLWLWLHGVEARGLLFKWLPTILFFFLTSPTIKFGDCIWVGFMASTCVHNSIYLLHIWESHFSFFLTSKF